MKPRVQTVVLITSLLTGFAACADPVLTVSDGVTSSGPITLTGGSGFFSTASFDSAWNVVVAAGASKPVIGSASSPNLELNIQATSAGAGKTLTITLSDNGFGPTAGNFNAQLVGQPLSGSGDVVNFNTFYDANNTLSALTTALTTSGSVTPVGNQYLNNQSGSLNQAGPYSLTSVVTIAGNTAATYSLLANLQGSNQPCTCPISFTCPSNQMICASDTVPNPQTEASQIVATDTCLGIVPVSFLGATTNGSCPSIITYTFGATSGCGKLFTCTQTITVNCLPNSNITTISNAVVGTTNLSACVTNAGTGAGYVWTISNGTITSGQGTPCITYTAGTDTNSPVHICVTVMTPAGCMASSCVDLALIPQTPSCPCAPHSIQYNFNGTQIIFQSTTGGSYIWFIADGTVKNLPSNKKVVVHISGQSITIPKTGSMPAAITIPVPDAFITFDPSATLATTTFDTVNNVWRETFPPSGLAGNIFYGGVAFKVPAAGLPGGIKNVQWNGSFTSDTTGLNINWQWSAANYSNFTSAYNTIAPKPTDDNQKSIYKNSDHAGTPEGTDPASSKLWQTFVAGGASGGGGGNYTGSGSSTISFPPCVCPNP